MKHRKNLQGVELKYNKTARKPIRSCRITPKHGTVSIDDVKECASRCGSHFFDKSNMRFFNSRVGQAAFVDHKGGAYFVTSEQNDRNPRRYTVRQYDPRSCSIKTVGEYGDFGSSRDAREYAKFVARAKAPKSTRKK